MQDFLNYSISQKIWGRKLIFCMWLDIYRSNKFTQSFQVGVVMHAQNDWKQRVTYISEMKQNLIFARS